MACCELIQIYFLDILYPQNCLGSIAENRISGLHSLKILDLSRNNLETLPNDLFKLPHLETLLIHRNKLVRAA